MKRVPPKPQPTAVGPDGEPIPQGEDTECAICDDGECENSNAIVFCDGCNLAVHQDCYGIPYIPEGQWLCRKCTVSPDRAVSCLLCPNEGGAFKQTTHGKWAHLLCAMWIPETGVSNPVYMEPIDSVDRVPKARWKLQCYLCKHRHGACIQCDNKSCFTAFHVTCARKAGLLIKAQRQRATAHQNLAGDASDEDDEDGNGEMLKAMCHKHLPKHLRRNNGPQAIGAENDENVTSSSTGASTPVLPSTKPSSRKITIRRGPNGSISAVVSAPTTTVKSARAYKKSYRAGPPLVPSYIVSRVLDYVSKVPLRKKQPLVIQIAKFWSLKREARRGAPLLKRLHLEPWTATSAPKELTAADRLKRLQFTLLLREDLERLRMLAELVRKREREKLRQANLLRQTLVDGILFPFNRHLRDALSKIMTLDRGNLFLSPVSRSEVPDYYDVVKEPMEWATISARIDDHYYQRISDFERDVNLVTGNAILYNKPDTSFWKTAQRVKKGAEPIVDQLRSVVRQLHSALEIPQPVAQHPTASIEPNLELEPPLDLVTALDDYSEERMLRTIREEENPSSAPSNVVEDLLRQYHHPERPPPDLVRQEREAKRQARIEKEEAAKGARKQQREAAKRAKEERAEQLRQERIERGEDPDEATQSAQTAATPMRRSGRSSGAFVSSPGSKQDGKLAVQQLDERDTFKRFEAGWILPKGQRRHGRETVQAPKGDAEQSGSQIASSKSTQPEGSRSRPSRVAALASLDSQRDLAGRSLKRTHSLRDGASSASEAKVAKRPRRSEPVPASEHPRNAASSQRSSSSPLSDLESSEAESTGLTQSRRLAAMQVEKARRQKEAEKATAVTNAVKALSKTQTPRRARSSNAHQTPSATSAEVMVASDFEPGTLVWGKLGGYPFFPAEVIDPTPSSTKEKGGEEEEEEEEEDSMYAVPATVLDAKEELPKGEPEGSMMHLVRFYDSSGSYGWVPTRLLRFLFEDEALDDKMLSSAKPSQRQGLRKALNKARMAAAGTLE